MADDYTIRLEQKNTEGFQSSNVLNSVSVVISWIKTSEESVTFFGKTYKRLAESVSVK